MWFSWVLDRVFHPPHFANDELQREASVLHATLVAILLCVIGLGGATAWQLGIGPETGSYVVFFGYCVLLFAMFRRGHVRATSLAFVWGIWFLIVAFLPLSGGMRGDGYVSLTIVVTLAGLLLGWRGAYGIAFASITVGPPVQWLTRVSPVHFAPGSPSMGWFIRSAFFLVTASMASLATTEIQRALRRSNKREAELKVANTALLAEIEQRREAEAREDALELQLREVQKMEALGTLAGGIAHDINNMLTVIYGMSAVLERRTAADDPRQRQVHEITVACQRGKELTQKLLGFARRRPLVREAVDVHTIVGEVVAILERTAPKSIGIQMRLDTELRAVEGDGAQLTQMVMNLGTNAIDAMPGGGTLTLSTRTVELSSHEEVAGTPLSAGRFIELAVEDSGVGMDATTLARACEPFFTTKAQGTGLGLSMVYGTAGNHGGRLWIESSAGKGTTVRVQLPASQRAPKLGDEEESRAFAFAGVTVLVVDDEDIVRDSTKTMLHELGCRVIVAAGGEEALVVVANDPVDLVLLDVRMPQMAGPEVLEALRRTHPSLRVILCTGYSDETQTEALQRLDAQGVLYKPFDLNDLARVLGGP